LFRKALSLFFFVFNAREEDCVNKVAMMEAENKEREREREREREEEGNRKNI
jgi:hypothetical protein